MPNRALIAVLVGFPVVGAVWSAGWAEPGLVAEVGLSQRLEHRRDSDADDSTRGVTALDFNLASVTRSQQLTLGLGANFAYDFDDDSTSVTETYSNRLGYQYLTQSAQFQFSAGYRETDIEDAILSDPIIDDDGSEIFEIETGEGSRRTLDLTSALILGQEGPLTLDLRYSNRQIRYIDTIDPDLDDSTRQSLSATIGARISPVLSLDASVSQRYLDQEDADGTDRTTTRYGLQGTYRLSPRTQLSASLNQTDIDSGSSNTNGMGYGLSLSHELKNGNVGAQLSASETVNGTRRQVQVSRSFEGRRSDGSISVGASRTGDLDTELLFNASLGYEISPNSSISLQLRQQSTVNDENEETIRSRLGVNYSLALTPRSGLSGGLQIARQDVLQGDSSDRSVLRGNLTYRHELVDDWAVVTGYEHQRTTGGTDGERRRETVFMGINKSFSFRP